MAVNQSIALLSVCRSAACPVFAGPGPRKEFAELGTRVDTGHGSARVEIGGRLDPLGAIHTELEALWSIHPQVPDDVRIQIAIAAVEVGANIIEHTSNGQPLQIGLSLELVDGQVHVAFTDNGPPVDIDLASVVMPDAMAERGRGLALAQSVLDQLAYRYDDVGNHWTLISQRFA